MSSFNINVIILCNKVQKSYSCAVFFICVLKKYQQVPIINAESCYGCYLVMDFYLFPNNNHYSDALLSSFFLLFKQFK